MYAKAVIPASCRGLDLAKAAKELISRQGNITAAAKALGVPAHDLRLLTRAQPRLIEAAFEAEEQALDKAEAEIRNALNSTDKARALAAAAALLRVSPAAKRRDWTREK
jgi:hypothetical protein